jgi:hypothetical protein
MAQHLRQQLAPAASEVAAAADSATTVLLLTGRTRTAWLAQQTARLPEALLTVVGSAIRLLESLERLWRRQWIDFRGWDLRRVDREKALPQVPEAVTQPRFPGVVNRVHQMLCALGALLFVLAGKMDQYAGASEDLGVALFAAAARALWWKLVARWLLRRADRGDLYARLQDRLGRDGRRRQLVRVHHGDAGGDRPRAAGRRFSGRRFSLAVAAAQGTRVLVSAGTRGAREAGAEPGAGPELAHIDRVHRLSLCLVPGAWRRDMKGGAAMNPGIDGCIHVENLPR